MINTTKCFECGNPDYVGPEIIITRMTNEGMLIHNNFNN